MDLVGGVVGSLLAERRGEVAGFLVDELSVVHGQRLQRCDRLAPPRPRLFADQRVERLHERHAQRSLLVDVDAAFARAVVIVSEPLAGIPFHPIGDVIGEHRKDGQPKVFGVQAAGDEQDTVSHRLGFETSASESPQQPVAGVDRCGLGVRRARGLPIGGRKHHQAVHRLQAPVVVSEVTRQPVDQFLVTGTNPHCAEIAGRGDESLAEMPMPEPIDHDPSCQRVLLAGNPAGQGHATTASRPSLEGVKPDGGRFLVTGETAEEPGLHDVARVVVFTSQHHSRSGDSGFIGWPERMTQRHGQRLKSLDIGGDCTLSDREHAELVTVGVGDASCCGVVDE